MSPTHYLSYIPYSFSLAFKRQLVLNLFHYASSSIAPLILFIYNDIATVLLFYLFQQLSGAQKLWSHTNVNSNTEVNHIINLDKI